MNSTSYALRTVLEGMLITDEKGIGRAATGILEHVTERALTDAQEAMQARCAAFVADYNWEGMLAIGYRPSAVALMCAKEMAQMLKPGEME